MNHPKRSNSKSTAPYIIHQEPRVVEWILDAENDSVYPSNTAHRGEVMHRRMLVSELNSQGDALESLLKKASSNPHFIPEVEQLTPTRDRILMYGEAGMTDLELASHPSAWKANQLHIDGVDPKYGVDMLCPEILITGHRGGGAKIYY